MTRPVRDQTVVVTGASSGIGRASVLELVRQGARVVAASRSEEALRSLEEETRGEPGEAVDVVADVGDPAATERLATAAVERWGRLDTWVSCAAVHEYAWFEDTTPEEFGRVLWTNVMGQVHGAYAALPHLAENDAGGVLIGVSSVEGVRAVPLQAPYVTSKFALRGFYDAIRMETARRHPGVAVTTILPASIDTPIFEHARTKLPRLPMPPRPLYAPEAVARAIVRAARRPRREVPVGGSAAGFILGQRLAPALMDVLLRTDRAMFGQQQTELPPEPSDNLDRPAPGWGSARSRRLESSAKVRRIRERSYATELVWQHPALRRMLVAGGVAGVGGAAGGALAAVGRSVRRAG